ncbi:MAG: hypothetical protein RLZZ115_2287 [Cyanobacteriota bacterium]
MLNKFFKSLRSLGTVAAFPDNLSVAVQSFVPTESCTVSVAPIAAKLDEAIGKLPFAAANEGAVKSSNANTT